MFCRMIFGRHGNSRSCPEGRDPRYLDFGRSLCKAKKAKEAEKARRFEASTVQCAKRCVAMKTGPLPI